MLARFAGNTVASPKKEPPKNGVGVPSVSLLKQKAATKMTCLPNVR